MSKLSARVPVLLSLLAAAAACTGGSQYAYADCTGTSPNFECSGSSAAQSINADNTSVTTATGFNVSATNKNALTISGDGQISYTDENASPLTSTSRAALNVISTGNDGATDGSVAIDVSGPLSGGTTGLSATNYGTGATSIKSGGTVQGQNGYGVYAANKNTAGTDLTIDANDTVIASSTAVSAVNDGTGLLSIDVLDVSGATGIIAKNKGLGALTINAAGAVEGKTGNGIQATNRNALGAGLSISTEDSVAAKRTAISATNYGAGLLTIDADGNLSGATGISATNRGSAALTINAAGKVAGTQHNAIVATNYGTDLTITTGDTVTAVKTAISAVNKGSGTLSVNAGGDVSGASGISATNNGTGPLTITAHGAVEASSGNAIYALNNNANSAALSIAAKKTVSAKKTAISATHHGLGPLSIDADGDVSGETGIGANNKGAGALSIDVAGQVTGSKYNGISATNAGTDLSIVMVDKVTAKRTGISAVNNGSGKLNVSARSDVSGASGISATNNGAGELSIAALGAVTATGGNGIYAMNKNRSGAALTIATKKAVSATNTAISATQYGMGPLSIDADGDVSGATGISANNKGDGALTIESDGTVTGSKNNGISATNEGTDLSITSSKTVSGARTGIAAKNNGTGMLKVDTGGDVSGGSGAGIQATNKNTATTDLTIATAEGTTVSGASGISATNKGSGTLNLDIDGDVIGTKSYGISTTIYGKEATVSTGAKSRVEGATTGLSATHRGTGPLTLEIDGAIEGLNGRGVYAAMHGAEPLNLNVGGSVSGTTDGVYARHYKDGPINVAVGKGSVVSSTGKSGSDFAIETVGGPTSLVVAGTVNPGAGGAVRFDTNKKNAFEDRLELHPTAVINGNVLAGPGRDTLAFGGSGPGNFDLDEIDTGDKTKKYQSFEYFEVDSGLWSFSGTTPYTFTVNGGTLKGTGTFGDLIANGGVIALGNSIGTMTVNGNLSLGSGSVFEVEVNDAGESDLVVAKGSVNLTGSTLRVLAQNGNYKTKTDYMIIRKDSDGAVNGKFAKLETNYAFLTPTVVYDGGDGNDVVLTLLRTVVPTTGGGSGGGGASGPGGVTYLSFCSVAESKNQCNVAEALDAFSVDNALFYSVLTQTEEGAREAFNALSGEVHATVAGTLVDDSRYARDAVMGRLMQASHRGGALGSSGPLVAGYGNQAMLLGGAGLYDGKALLEAPAPLAFWTQGFGAWGEFGGNKNAASADRNLGGFISGMDADVGDSWRVGVATGASFSDVSVDERYSTANVQSYYLGGYAGGMAGDFALRGGGLWAWSDIETSRAVVFPDFYERQNANYDADTGQLFGEVAYPTQMGGFDLEPFAGLAFVSVESGGFTEKGGAEASLRGSDSSQDVGYTTLGVRAAKTMMWGDMAVTPHMEAAWLHAFNDVTPNTSLAFATTGTGFDVSGVPLAEDSALLDAGLDFALSERLEAGVSYSGQYADSVSDNAVKGRLTWRFN